MQCHVPQSKNSWLQNGLSWKPSKKLLPKLQRFCHPPRFRNVGNLLQRHLRYCQLLCNPNRNLPKKNQSSKSQCRLAGEDNSINISNSSSRDWLRSGVISQPLKSKFSTGPEA